MGDMSLISFLCNWLPLNTLETLFSQDEFPSKKIRNKIALPAKQTYVTYNSTALSVVAKADWLVRFRGNSGRLRPSEPRSLALHRNCLPALISPRSSDKVSSASAPLLESPEMRSPEVFHGNTSAASDRLGQWLDTYVTLKPSLALILLHVARMASQKTMLET